MAWVPHILRQLRYKARRLWIRLYGIEIADSCLVGSHTWVGRGYAQGHKGKVSIGPNCVLSQGVIVDAWAGSITLERDVFLGPYTVVYGHGGVVIGADTLISGHCTILSSNHAIPDRNTVIRSRHDLLLPTRLGRDVWLGAGVRVLGGVTIGDGCVVGAGAVVTEDLPPYSVAVGVPARVVKYRPGSEPEA